MEFKLKKFTKGRYSLMLGNKHFLFFIKSKTHYSCDGNFSWSVEDFNKDSRMRRDNFISLKEAKEWAVERTLELHFNKKEIAS
tara:strand:+ start:3902 stop:4150 length:249 start_codon:yes stop_codon:yes gene_type:complete